jgi:hypothetical protein
MLLVLGDRLERNRELDWSYRTLLQHFLNRVGTGALKLDGFHGSTLTLELKAVGFNSAHRTSSRGRNRTSD